MRSRYSAYAFGLSDYVMATTAPGTPAWSDDPNWRAQIDAYGSDTRFVGLEITDAPPPVGDVGFVTFRAQLSQGGCDAGFSERSRFERRDGRWLYASGERIE